VNAVHAVLVAPVSVWSATPLLALPSIAKVQSGPCRVPIQAGRSAAADLTTIAPDLLAIATGEPAEEEIAPDQFMAPDDTSLPVWRLVLPCSSDGRQIERFVVRLFLYRPESR
jgi:hypothetical protein